MVLLDAKVFVPGKRYTAVLCFSVFINEFAVFVFYFIYRYLFSSVISEVPLAIIFLLIGLGLGWLTVHFGNKLRRTIRYEVTERTLIVHQWRLERMISWEDFTAANTKSINFFDTYPVYFEVKGERFEISQYVDHVVDLGYEIISRMPASADISDSVRQMTQALRCG